MGDLCYQSPRRVAGNDRTNRTEIVATGPMVGKAESFTPTTLRLRSELAVDNCPSSLRFRDANLRPSIPNVPRNIGSGSVL